MRAPDSSSLALPAASHLPPVPRQAASSINCSDSTVGAHSNRAISGQPVRKGIVPLKASLAVNAAISAVGIQDAQALFWKGIVFVATFSAQNWLLPWAAQCSVDADFASPVIKRVVPWLCHDPRSVALFAVVSIINGFGDDARYGKAGDDFCNIFAVSGSRRRCYSNAKRCDNGECKRCQTFHSLPPGANVVSCGMIARCCDETNLEAKRSDAQYRGADMRYQEGKTRLLLIFTTHKARLGA